MSEIDGTSACAALPLSTLLKQHWAWRRPSLTHLPTPPTLPDRTRPALPTTSEPQPQLPPGPSPDDPASRDPDAGQACPTFLTLVLNGLPFLHHHITALAQLEGGSGSGPCPGAHPWEWHIIEGLASGRAHHKRPYSTDPIPEAFHDHGLSLDGTSQYLDLLAASYPNVHVHRACGSGRHDCAWLDKLVMLNTVTHALNPSPYPRVLIEMDADELWTAAQLRRVLQLFAEGGGEAESGGAADCAYFDCHYFVGPDLVTVTPGGYGHTYAYEWLRAWRVPAGALAHWASHAPPLLLVGESGAWRSLTGEKVGEGC